MAILTQIRVQNTTYELKDAAAAEKTYVDEQLAAKTQVTVGGVPQAQWDADTNLPQVVRLY